MSRRKSRLDFGMTLRHRGRRLPTTPEAFAAAFPDPTNKASVFVHGLAATEWLWSLSSEEHYGDPDVTFGTRLRDDLGFTPIYLRYKSGRSPRIGAPLEKAMNLLAGVLRKIEAAGAQVPAELLDARSAGVKMSFLSGK